MDWHVIRTPRANRSNKFIIRSNGLRYPFEKNLQPFEQLELSVQKNHLLFKQLELPVQEHSSAVRTAQAIGSKNS